MMKEKTNRNLKIVDLIDNKGLSFAEVARILKLKAKSTVHEIYWRTKDKIKLSTG